MKMMIFLETSFSAYEDTTKTGNSRYEYILPELIFNKILHQIKVMVH